jgi:hypothetical protein
MRSGHFSPAVSRVGRSGRADGRRRRAARFANVQALHDEGGAIVRSIRSREPLTPAGWRRALLATELVFASDLIGSGVDWPTTTGFTDQESIRILRSIQRKLASITRRA